MLLLLLLLMVLGQRLGLGQGRRSVPTFVIGDVAVAGDVVGGPRWRRTHRRRGRGECGRFRSERLQGREGNFGLLCRRDVSGRRSRAMIPQVIVGLTAGREASCHAQRVGGGRNAASEEGVKQIAAAAAEARIDVR